jgi:hypothetical protein
LYATQRTAKGPALVRYDHDARVLDEDPFHLGTGFTPRGLTNAWPLGSLWLVADEKGGVAMLGGEGERYNTFDPTLAARGVIIGLNGVYASGVLAGDMAGSLRVLSNDGAGNPTQAYFAENLAGPEQIVMDANDQASLLVALSGEAAVLAFDFESAQLVRSIRDFPEGAEPTGVFPLLNGRWLVAGKKLGARVVLPGTHVREITSTPVSEDAAYISRVCLP